MDMEKERAARRSTTCERALSLNEEVTRHYEGMETPRKLEVGLQTKVVALSLFIQEKPQ